MSIILILRIPRAKKSGIVKVFWSMILNGYYFPFFWWGAVVLWAYSSCISLLTAPRVGGSNPRRSSFRISDFFKNSTSLVNDSRRLNLTGTSGTTGIDSPDSRCTCTLKRRHTLEEEDRQAFESGKWT